MEQITPRENFTTALDGLFRVDGKVAWLPGGYGGIGEAIAWGLAMHGAEVVISGRDGVKAEMLAQAIREAGLKAHGSAVDVTSVAEIR